MQTLQQTREATLSTLRVERDFYTTKQISEIYNVSVQTVSAWCRKGYIQASLVGQGKGRWRIHPGQLEDEISTHRDTLIEMSKRYWPMMLAKMRR